MNKKLKNFCKSLEAPGVRFGLAAIPHLPRPDGSCEGEPPYVIPSEKIALLDCVRAAQEVARRITTFYEESIRIHPECWLWSYKRWRYIPEGMPADPFPYYADRPPPDVIKPQP